MLEQRVDDKAFAQCIYSSKPPLNIKYEDTNKFDAYDRMMRTNKGISGPM